MANIQVEKHEPERRRPGVTAVYCGCTCCCCCCLHTLGSIIGAAVAPVLGSGGQNRGHWTTRAMTPRDDDGDIDIRLPGRLISSVGFFWWLTLAFTVLSGFAFSLLSDTRSSETLLVGGIVILLGFPVIQLAAALVTLVVYACIDAPDRSYQLGRIGKAIAGIFVGTIFGILVMTGIGFLMAR